jgi:hypothetical protein
LCWLAVPALVFNGRAGNKFGRLNHLFGHIDYEFIVSRPGAADEVSPLYPEKRR